MKILLLTMGSEYPTGLGGLTTHMKVLGDAFKKLENEVDYFSITQLPYYVRVFIAITGNFFRHKELLRTIKFILYKFAIGASLIIKQMKNSYSVIVAQDVYSYNSAFLTRKILRTPVILTVHTYQTYQHVYRGEIKKGSFFETLFLKEEKKAYNSAKKIITVDTRLKEYLIESFNTPPEKITVFKNFVDSEEFFPRNKEIVEEYRKKLNIPSNKKIILFPRRLDPKCGTIYAVKAAEILKLKYGTNFVLVLTGSGPDEVIVKEYIKEKNLTSNVTLTGDIPLENMKFLYNLADVAIMPSITIEGLQEATSISALEAMASGVPVIASRIGGLKEIIEDGKTGYLIPEKNPEELAEKIMDVLKGNVGNIVQNARQEIKKNYSSTERAKEFLKCFKKEAFS